MQASADLGITKFAVGSPIAGTDIHYEYQVSNDGPSVARDVTLRDFLPGGISFISAQVDYEGGLGGVPLPCDVTVGSNAVFCPLGDVAPTDGVPIIVFINVHIAANVPDGTVLTNHADVLLTDTPDPDPANNSDEAAVTVQTRADVEVSKTADADTYKASGFVIYTIWVSNNGPSDAQGVVMTDDLPVLKKDRVMWFPGSPPCSKPAGGTLLTCNLGTIAAGDAKRVVVAVNYKGNRGLIENTAEATSATTDLSIGNNSSTVGVWVGVLPKP